MPSSSSPTHSSPPNTHPHTPLTRPTPSNQPIPQNTGGLLSFNLLYPSDDPSIPRLMGMWSVWMFTIPSLRARECLSREKDALNVLFLAVPLLNIALPFLWKSFPFIFCADVVTVAGVYWWYGVWRDVYGFDFAYSDAEASGGGGSGEQE